MYQFRLLTAAALIFSVLSSVTRAQSLEELRKEAERAKARREALEKRPDPAPEPARAEPVKPKAPPVAAQVERAPSHQQQNIAQPAWAPSVGDVFHGFQEDDGSINVINKGRAFWSTLRIISVSSNRTQFAGKLNYSSYRLPGSTRTPYWRAKVLVHGRIKERTVTLRFHRILDAPADTFLNKSTFIGVTDGNEIRGTWKSPRGGHGNFSFRPGKKITAAERAWERRRTKELQSLGYLTRKDIEVFIASEKAFSPVFGGP